MFNPVAPYGYLLSDMYLFMADITNPDFLVYSCRTWIGLDITRFCEQHRQPSSGSAWPACPRNDKSGIPRRNHITIVLRELHWLRIHDRIIFKILLLTHKAVNNTAPEYLCDLIRLNVKSMTICTRASFDPCTLCVPPISKTCANSFFDRSFVYAAPTLWNALDLDIRLLPFYTFKKVSRHIFI